MISSFAIRMLICIAKKSSDLAICISRVLTNEENNCGGKEPVFLDSWFQDDVVLRLTQDCVKRKNLSLQNWRMPDFPHTGRFLLPQS